MKQTFIRLNIEGPQGDLKNIDKMFIHKGVFDFSKLKGFMGKNSSVLSEISRTRKSITFLGAGNNTKDTIDFDYGFIQDVSIGIPLTKFSIQYVTIDYSYNDINAIMETVMQAGDVIFERTFKGVSSQQLPDVFKNFAVS